MSFNQDEVVRHGEITEVLERHNLGDKDILERLVSLCKD